MCYEYDVHFNEYFKDITKSKYIYDAIYLCYCLFLVGLTFYVIMTNLLENN